MIFQIAFYSRKLINYIINTYLLIFVVYRVLIFYSFNILDINLVFIDKFIYSNIIPWVMILIMLLFYFLLDFKKILSSILKIELILKGFDFDHFIRYMRIIKPLKVSQIEFNRILKKEIENYILERTTQNSSILDNIIKNNEGILNSIKENLIIIVKNKI